ncbi:ral guanine nucleotide dissociation stimulator-like [Oryx dammah]|uniref:ral guanine nucleotide dissociation stimulator-like n=1 Tax=Oryx dammah TaxID=59534 RepID=UPI001A9B6195|nr:ral guanine nucleotide dissociation stimulator-like [Oryx dammah]
MLQAPRLQQPAPPTRRRGRDALGIHVTIGLSRAPQACSSHPFHAARETRLLGKNGAADNRPSARPLAWPPPQASSKGSPARRAGRPSAARFPDSAQPRKPGFPPTRPSARSEASDTPAGARPSLLARAGSRPALCGAERTWRLLSALPPGALGGQWRLLNGGGIAHARKASAPHSGIALPLWCGSKVLMWSGVCILGGGQWGEWWACVWRGDVWGSEKHHRQLAGALRLSAWMPGTCSQGSSRDCRQEPVHGAPCSISLHDRPEPHTSNRAQGRHRGKSVSTGDRNETCRVLSVQRCRLETLVGKLVPAFLGGDPAYLPTFLGTYRAFGTPQQVLDLLFTRYGCILPYCDEDGGPLHQLKMAMASILGTWLHLYPEDFQQSPEFPCLQMLLAYIELNMPGSDLEQRARHLLAQLETLEPTEAEGHAPAGEEALETSPELTPSAPLIPAAAPQSEQAQSPAPTQVQDLHQVNMPAPNPEPQHAHTLALT